MRSKFIKRAGAPLLVLALLASACGDDDDSDAATASTESTDTSAEPTGDTTSNEPVSEEPIKIGAILDFTGPFTAASGFFRDGIEGWVDHVNANGGIHGRTIEVIFEDGKADPTEAQTAATRLISQEGVSAIGCVLGSSAALAAAEVAASEDIVMLPCAYSDALFEPPRRTVFVPATPYAHQMARAVEALVDETNATTAAVVYSADEFGDSGLRGARAAFDATDVDEVASESFERGAQDLQAQARAVIRERPEMVVCVCVFSQSALLAAAMDRLGAADLPIVAPNPTVGPPFFTIAGPSGGSVHAADYVAHVGTPGWDEAAAAMQDVFGRDPNSFELLGLLNMAILTRALEDTGGDDSTDALVEALENFDAETVAGLAVEVTFGPDQRFASLQTAVYRADAAESSWNRIAGIAEAESLDD